MPQVDTRAQMGTEWGVGHCLLRGGAEGSQLGPKGFEQVRVQGRPDTRGVLGSLGQGTSGGGHKPHVPSAEPRGLWRPAGVFGHRASWSEGSFGVLAGVCGGRGFWSGL